MRRKIPPKRPATFLQTVLYLLLTAGLVFVLMSISACDCDEDGRDDCDGTIVNPRLVSANLQMRSKPAANFVPHIRAASSSAAPGARVRHNLSGSIGTPAPNRVDYKWRHPEGASSFSFADRQPSDYDPKTGTFFFNNVPPGEEISVDFNLPMDSPGDMLSEFLDSAPDNGPEQTALFQTHLEGGQAARLPAPGSVPFHPALAPQQVTAWEGQYWLTREITVSAAECQEAVDFLQGDAAFLVMQFPEPAHALTESFPLPLAAGAVLELVDYDGGLDVQGRIAVQPARFHFAANELPAAPGHYWAALGASADTPVTCPAAPETGNWEIYIDLWLDLDFAPDDCEGCVLDMYVCYEGQALPGNPLERYIARQRINRNLERTVRAADEEAGLREYRDWGITCAGPLSLQLVDNPGWTDWMVAGGTVQWVTPTWGLTLTHVLEGDPPNPPQLVDLDYATDLDAGWYWSDGTQPIVPPINYAGGWPPQNIYLIGAVPPDAAPSAYTVRITATLVSDPTNFRLGTSIVYVGDWEPPPLPPPCPGPDEVTISGPASVDPGSPYLATAAVAPPTVTTPLTYTWEAAGQTSLVHALRFVTDTAAFTWSVGGVYAITVTADNSCGPAVVDTHLAYVGTPPPCNGLGAVDLSGPTGGYSGVTYSFDTAAGPPTATTPITYVYRAGGQAAVTHTNDLQDAVGFTWAAPGAYTITLDATNCGGSASDTHTIVIAGPPPCAAVTGVALTGPTTGLVGVPCSFAAAAAPPTATVPVTYTWHADGQSTITHTNDLHDGAAFTWGYTGTYLLTVTAVNCASVPVHDVHTIQIVSISATHWIYLPVVFK